MFYVIELKLAFHLEGVPRSIFNHAIGQADHAIPINPGQPEEEQTYIRLVECYHDENPHQPCQVIDEVIPYPPNEPPFP